MPRYLSKAHLEIMHKKMEDWENKMESVQSLCVAKAQELMQN